MSVKVLWMFILFIAASVKTLVHPILDMCSPMLPQLALVDVWLITCSASVPQSLVFILMESHRARGTVSFGTDWAAE